MATINTLAEQFQQIVQTFSDKVVIIDEKDQPHTYAELDQYSNQIASYLSQQGLPTNYRIGICVGRSFDTIDAILAVVKLGYTYVAMSMDLPDSRIKDICDKAQLQMLVANNHNVERYQALVKNVVDIDQAKANIQANTQPNYPVHESKDLPANIIFTSGTISKPKGILITADGIINLIDDQNYAALTADDVFLQVNPLEFDGSTLEIWGTLLKGATLVLNPPGYPILSLLAEKIEKYHVSMVFITTQLFNLMVDNRLEAIDSVAKILTGGELASAKHFIKFLAARKHNKYLANIYGPAECSTFSSFFPIKPDFVITDETNIPIGGPVKGAQTFVVDADRNVVPTGVEGELVVCGIGVADGYLDEPELTAAKFTDLELDGQPCKRCYLTGDKVYRDANGDLVFLGRFDKEVKVRGYRILPSEIEYAALQHADVQMAAVQIKKLNPTDKYVELYLTLNVGAVFNKRDFQLYLKKVLPGYIQVNKIHVLEEMPLRSNGKIDYQQLDNQ